IWVVRIMFGDEMIGMMSMEREVDSLALWCRLIVVSPVHRGVKLSVHGMAGAGGIARSMGAAVIYGMATLHNPSNPQALEHAGYRLLAFFPGYDRAEVAPGVVKRVYLAVYAKLLVAEDQVQWPDTKNMTPVAKALYELLFSDALSAGGRPSARSSGPA